MDDLNPTASAQSPNNKKIIFIALFLVVIVMFLATITFIISNAGKFGQKNTTNTGTITPGAKEPTPITTGTVGKTIGFQPPEVKFAKWIEPKSAPTELPSSSVYTFKQNYTQKEIGNLATKLQATTAINTRDPSKFTYYNTSNLNVVAFKFDKKTGSFSYVNTNGTPLATGSAQIQDKIYAFLSTLGWSDPTIKITADYKRTETPGVVYYELHRDWEKTGLPILNFLGLFNLTENQTLKALTLNSKENMPKDETVYDSSDSKDGLKRADDFNTMTIAVSEDDDRVLSINSNLRQIVPTSTRTVSLQTYQAALEKLKSNQYESIFTTPSGNGSVAWQKIYPGNKAVSNQAVVDESSYAYLEHYPSEPQAELKPYILFKGTSVLDSGYSVNFVAAVDITPKTVAMRSQVLGTSTYLAQGPQIPEDDSSSQKRGELEVTLTPNPTITPTGPVRDCQPKVSELNPTISYTDAKGNTINLGLGQYQRLVPTKEVLDTRNEQRWYYIPPNDINQKTYAEKEAIVRTAFQTYIDNIGELEKKVIEKKIDPDTLYCPDKKNPGHTDKSCKRTWDLLLGDFERYQGYYNQSCPLIFSGFSPVLFIYGPEGSKLNVRSWGTLTYADPGAKDGAWDVILGKNGNMNVNNVIRQSIYYEYAPISFNRPQLGWNVNRSDIDTFVETVSSKLGLKSLEEQRLQQEIKNAVQDVNGEQLFAGLIDRQELDAKLPLSINPRPQNVERFHFYVGTKQNSSVTSPVLNPVERIASFALEFGAVPGK